MILGICLAAAVSVVVIVSLDHPGKDIVSLHGDSIVKVNGSEISLEELSKRKFTRPVIIRSFADSSPILMHKVIDRLNAPDAEFDDGKFKGWRPNFTKKGTSNSMQATPNGAPDG